MQKTLPEQRTFLFVLGLISLLLFATAVSDENPADEAPAAAYREARAEMVAAYQAQNYAAMRAGAARSLDARPGYAGALFNLALAQVLDGDADASLATLNELLVQQIDFGVADIDEFAALQQLPDWEEYAAAVAALYEPIGNARVLASYSEADFIPEGIAAGANGEIYLGSIRHGDILRLAESTEQLAVASDGPHWSVFGIRLAGDGKLWFVSSAIAEYAELDAADEGMNGLYAIDMASGDIVVRALLPKTENKQVLGDLILVDEDTIFLADQADGIIYSYSISSGEFSVVLQRGALASPQGLVLDASGENLYVADYIGGLYRVDIKSGSTERLAPPESASVYGIDGLYRYGDELIAIQNGIRPNRVAAFTLSDDGAAITASRILAMNLPEFDEPNLGTIRGDEFLFIANSHWNRFDRDGNLPDDLIGPIVLSISLLD